MGMDWKAALKSLKGFCGQNMTKELEGLEESLKGWEARDERREASFKTWKEIDSNLRAERDAANLQIKDWEESVKNLSAAALDLRKDLDAANLQLGEERELCARYVESFACSQHIADRLRTGFHRKEQPKG